MVDAAGAAGRLSTGVAGLDALLGGGLLPGTLTVVVGASGIGKTQLGVQFAAAGQAQEGRRGVVLDLNARLDSQSHREYARRIAGWELAEFDAAAADDPARVFDRGHAVGDYLCPFGQSGRRVTRDDLGFDGWHDWQALLAARLQETIGFFYAHFVRGVRRAVVDGVEPADRPRDSIQLELFEYVYHQILRKESDWVARDLFRQHYRSQSGAVAAEPYDFRQVACLLLCTSHETLLEPLIERPLAEGDVLASANTLIYLGKVRQGRRLARALYVAKHRGSACSEEIAPFEIGPAGLRLLEE
jgi:KaiC/GvpD/RAD55 family RecA-like ATPase